MPGSTVLANVVMLPPWSYVDDVRLWAIVLIGVTTSFALRRKLGKAAWPLVGLFVLAADSHFYWAKFLVKLAFARLGYETLAGTLTWYVTWQLIPVLFAAVMAAAFVSEIRRRGAHRAHSRFITAMSTLASSSGDMASRS